MPSWGFKCKDCNQSFPFSAISESLADFYLPRKPVLPQEGVEHECPNCKVKSTYWLSDLIYQNGVVRRKD
jgi:hypothetical protein